MPHSVPPRSRRTCTSASRSLSTRAATAVVNCPSFGPVLLGHGLPDLRGGIGIALGLQSGFQFGNLLLRRLDALRTAGLLIN